MKIRTQVLLGLAAIVTLMFGASLNNNAAAEGRVDNSGLSVAPTVTELGYLDAGKSYEQELTFENVSDKKLSFKLETSSFWAADESYELKWGVSQSQFGKIAEWTDIDKSKTHILEPGESYKVAYTITVPEDQPGGAQRLMVTVNLGTIKGDGFVETQTNINTLVYANINGDVVPGAEVKSQDIQGFSFTPSISTQSVLKNIGDVDLNVTYRMHVTDFFSGKEAFTKEEEKILMTESSRMYEQIWHDAPLLGVFNVTQEITMLGKTNTYSGVTIICPIWMLLAIVIVITGAVVYLVYRNKMRKK